MTQGGITIFKFKYISTSAVLKILFEITHINFFAWNNVAVNFLGLRKFFYWPDSISYRAASISYWFMVIICTVPTYSMASKCAVPNCKSVSEAGNGITWHYFPKDQKILQEWIRNIPRSDWMPTKWSQICSLHFTPDCFTMESQDTNKYRKKTEVQKQIIRKGSVPTLFPDSPAYLLKNTPLHHSDNAQVRSTGKRQSMPAF